MVADRADRLAADLGRAKLETWPTEGAEAGLLDLWVADKGKLGRGAGAWPLLHDGHGDVFDGMPFGRSQRGAIVTAPIMERNYMIGGQPGQGKSSAGRTLCPGCILAFATKPRLRSVPAPADPLRREPVVRGSRRSGALSAHRRRLRYCHTDTACG
jgi:S-DNA-T family DNA segregation ATPase FtsK/SpoIIIE